MAKIITTEQQNKFLIKEGIYSQWLENVTTRHPDEDLDFTKFEDPGGFIINAFSWSSSPEGHTFWCNYYDKFIDEL